jgi:D-alanyl-D-alanine dipeptidase
MDAATGSATSATCGSQSTCRILSCFLCAVAVALCTTPAHSQLAPGFVYLADIDASIAQDMRYAGAHNFIGRPIAGYEAPECILTRQAAQALTKAQEQLLEKSLSLIVWDCYRPERAVADFVAWSKIKRDTRMKAEFYPGADKSRLFALGYIASRSGHSRGSTVDICIVPKQLAKAPAFDPAAPLRSCIAPKTQRFEDGALDFGTGYDCFDERAATAHPGIDQDARANRQLLKSVMEQAGLENYPKEWWHFGLKVEPFHDRGFDFPIAARNTRS